MSNVEDINTDEDKLNVSSKNNSSFIDSLARYYSEFLSTDFKKGRLPKRKFQIKDSKGRRSGIPLSKYKSFKTNLRKKLIKNIQKNDAFSIKFNEHKSKLSIVTENAIEGAIKNISTKNFDTKNTKLIEKFTIDINKKNADIEKLMNTFIEALQNNLSLDILAPLIELLEPTFKKTEQDLIDRLISVDSEITNLFIEKITEDLPSAIPKIITDNDPSLIEQIIDENFNENYIKKNLKDFFNDFSANDLYSEMRELQTVEKLDDNLEFYLYLGEIKFNSNTFPIFYIPMEVANTKDKNTILECKLDSRILINKKAIDFIAREIQETTKTKSASPIKERIVYLDAEDVIFEKIDAILQEILASFSLNGYQSFENETKELKNSTATINTSLSISLFDKSDESMLSDYEELLDKILRSSDESPLFNFLTSLIESFIHKNPTDISEGILDEWDETNITERLVFDTPLPLAEEQRKILLALNNEKSKFITVEGPPGTGKSHTISAIAFEAILKGQKILVLSDKKEALDVVQNKINETLSRVRPTDDFINPILRLGRAGSNFRKLTTGRAIENLNIQHREFKKQSQKRENLYKNAVDNLKSKISNHIKYAKDIDMSKVTNYELDRLEFFNEFDDYKNLENVFENIDNLYTEEIKNLKHLADIRNKLKKYTKNFTKLFHKFDKNKLEFLNFMIFISDCKNTNTNNFYNLATKVNSSNYSDILNFSNKITLSKGMFGYFFSGTKIQLIKNDLKNTLGINFNGTPHSLIQELEKIYNDANSFFTNLENKGWKDKLFLYREIFELDIDLKELDEVIKTYKLINSKDIIYIKDPSEIIDILCENDSDSGLFLERFLELQNTRDEISKSFYFDDYNYLARKQELENYNALKLATEIDSRVIDFAQNKKNDAKTLSDIIRKKLKFPKEKFSILSQAFPCMICSLRDYAEYIPLEKELFDIIIIDEASQVSIAQALPAIIRSKKMVVMGDRKQFGNVKTSQASKEINNSYFTDVMKELDHKDSTEDEIKVKAQALNISFSVLDFMERVSNFNIGLKKHFRGYPEMISFSSKYFYENTLQPMKIRGKPLSEVLEFIHIEPDSMFDKIKNTNEKEADLILEKIIKQLDDEDFRSVAVITPFTAQQTYISRTISNHTRYQEILEKLKFRCFTFDSCQGEERDIIYYSFVANEQRDMLWSIFPKYLHQQDEDELDRNLKMQRLNVGFSRGKEKLIFIHSKPINELKSCLREALNHYSTIVNNAYELPSEDKLDKNSPAEKKVLRWLESAPIIRQYQPEIDPQFKIGDYLKSLDKSYDHPAYRVDFLLRFFIDNKQYDIIIEYDGFEYHFKNHEDIDAGNWEHYLRDQDIEREKVLESYGYKTLRINRFNIGKDPILELNKRIENLLNEFKDNGEALIKSVVENTNIAVEGIATGDIRVCKKCNQNKPAKEFENPERKSGYNRYCSSCSPRKRTKKKINRSKNTNKPGQKRCKNCKKFFPDSEFIDNTNISGKRVLCSKCKTISNRKREEQARIWHSRGRRYR